MQPGECERWNKVSTGRDGRNPSPYTVAELMLTKLLLFQQS